MKYNLKPFKFSSHDKIINLVDKNKKVLDIGCASGYLASFLKEKGCVVDGVDTDEELIKIAKKYCNAYILDISKDNVVGKYDIIILGDILEHLENPDKVLLSLKENLNDDGYIIISIPNIANIYPRLKILFGNFDYEEIGIFDKTHLRFFTRKSFKELIKNTGYKIEKLEYTPIPIYLKFPNIPKLFLNPIYYLLYILAICWPTMFAYQFVVKIKAK
ncbi:MAG: class I SAM-dependent methyltransferase [archaeon]|nr:class I SAM-dependent methyltransferase [archaeon]